MNEQTGSGSGSGRDEESRADLVPFDFSAIRPSADRARFDRTVSALAAEMTAVRSGGPAPLNAGQTAATFIAWRRRVGLAAAAVTVVAVSSLLRSPRAETPVVPPQSVAESAGISPSLALWTRANHRPTASDIIAAFSSHLTSPLF